jgi:hypothetical protein
MVAEERMERGEIGEGIRRIVSAPRGPERQPNAFASTEYPFQDSDHFIKPLRFLPSGSLKGVWSLNDPSRFTAA